jgi:uncharacterized protein YegP (UPF0339 family)
MRVDIYQDKAGGWRWRLRARNGRIVAESGEGYSSKRKVLQACDRMWRYAWDEIACAGGDMAWAFGAAITREEEKMGKHAR